MTSLWPRLEPLLTRVRKSARSIGSRDGALPRFGQGQGDLHLVDIGPGIFDLPSAESESMSFLRAEWIGESTGHAVVAVLTTSGRGFSPTEVIEVLVPGGDLWNHHHRVSRINQLRINQLRINQLRINQLRINQWIERDGERVDVPTDRLARPQVCA